MDFSRENLHEEWHSSHIPWASVLVTSSGELGSWCCRVQISGNQSTVDGDISGTHALWSYCREAPGEDSIARVGEERRMKMEAS
jgi:hypothetical protein